MSEELGYEPRVRSAEEVRAEVAGLSSAVFDMVGVKGRITEGGPMELPWDEGEDPDAYHSMTHLWSLYGADEAALEAGMRSLAEALPQRGWTVVKNGPDSSASHSQEILAVHLPTRAQLEATLHRHENPADSLIAFCLYSPLFAPQPAA